MALPFQSGPALPRRTVGQRVYDVTQSSPAPLICIRSLYSSGSTPEDTVSTDKVTSTRHAHARHSAPVITDTSARVVVPDNQVRSMRSVSAPDAGILANEACICGMARTTS